MGTKGKYHHGNTFGNRHLQFKELISQSEIKKWSPETTQKKRGVTEKPYE